MIDGNKSRHNEQGSTKNDINSYNNNLLQENVKLRKLLTLQQKAIAFRRSNCWKSLSETNFNEDDTDFVDDSKSSSSRIISSLSSSNHNGTFQCIYCPKIFSDSKSFIKHLSLRHLSSSVDDGLPSSITSNGTSSGSSYLDRIRQQYCYTPSVEKTKTDSNVNQSLIDQLQTEILNLKTKLNETEKILQEEQSARLSFENDLKSDFVENVRSIQEQLLKKIDEVKLLRKEPSISLDHVENVNREKVFKNVNNSDSLISSIKDNNLNEIDEPKNKLIENIPTEKSKILEPSNGSPPQTESKSESNSVSNQKVDLESPKEKRMDISEMKKTLRLELISQLTTKRSEKHQNRVQNINSFKPELKLSEMEDKKDIESQQIIKENNDISVNLDKSNADNREITKAEIHYSVENRLKEYLQMSSTTTTPKDLPEESNLNEETFTEAMNKVQRDRNLLIQQSRHDYDFEQIESTLRNLIDSKVRSKLQQSTNNENDDTQEISKSVDSTKTEELVAESQSNGSLIEYNIEEIQSNLMNKISNNDQTPIPTAPPSEEIELRSILKLHSPSKIKISKSNQRISFSDQVIEYPISPRELSEDDDSDSDEPIDSHQLNNNVSFQKQKRNQMFVIRSINDEDYVDEETEQQLNETTPTGEKIFLNEFTSSSSSSDEDDHNEDGNSKKTTLNTTHSKAIPQAAERKSKNSSNSTLDSLLSDDIASSQSTTQSNRVNELAQLIERKLQQTTSSNGSESTLNNLKRLPPIGSIDTLARRNIDNGKRDDIKTKPEEYIYDF